ncbi:sulfatase [Candidatus Fermentibacteria bacterium]|nr:sulfatase [Candidatus Fermentibacteria bacterium]
MIPPVRPNVLFIVIDALRADHLGFAGYQHPTSPCLDILAAEGTAFTTATAQAPFTMTSMPSLLSGRYPGSTFRWTRIELADFGMQNAVVLGEGIGLLPAYLYRRGYTTGAFTANPVVANQIRGIRAHFDHFDDQLRHRWTLDSAQNLNRLAHQWIRSLGDAPWFCYLHYMDVHDPYYPPAEFARRFAPSFEKFPEPTRPWMNELVRRGGPSPAEFGNIVAMYDAGIAYLDHEICAFLDVLASEERTRDLLVVVASDHGEEFMEHGSMGHGQSLHDELLRCPLILWWPGKVPQGLLVETPVSNVDIVPTVLDLVGIRPPAGIEGTSLVRAFRGTIPQGPVFSQTQGFAVRRGRWKLWQRPNGDIRLYDLDGDPGETVNRAAEYPDTLAALTDEVHAWYRGLVRPPMPASEAEGATIDAETVQLLKRLGYVE